jgi:hypothetical protein
VCPAPPVSLPPDTVTIAVSLSSVISTPPLKSTVDIPEATNIPSSFTVIVPALISDKSHCN